GDTSHIFCHQAYKPAKRLSSFFRRRKRGRSAKGGQVLNFDIFVLYLIPFLKYLIKAEKGLC
ncbi:MAG: hypothetical protein CO106_02335, partial [Deltaproteobacteria bacterium CG_4_9_14_3_um_filter_44_9]